MKEMCIRDRRKPKGKRNGAMIAIVAVVVVALIASAVFFTRVIGIGGRSYEDTIEDMVDAMNDADICLLYTSRCV